VLIGREAERERLDALIAHARSGHGGALALSGDAGIGKTALLEDAAERAESAGTRVLRARGIESETELPFAALHQLIHPIASLVDGLPEPQAKALNAALAVSPADGVDRFAVYAATLTLLGAAAAAEPLVCVIDDVHGLDEASAGAISFVALRLAHEAVAMLFAARQLEETPLAVDGVELVRLPPLGANHARELLASERSSLRPPQAEAVVRSSRGNPLALLEFAGALADQEVPAPLDEPLGVGEEVRRTFGRRAERLSSHAQRALLLAATGEGSGADAVWSALELEGILPDAVAETLREGLLLPGRDVGFCHPLARSAIYHGAPPAELRAAHETLAMATRDPIARAWHLAEAAKAPDPAVAEALEQAAVEARKRGGASVEATALERSAELTSEAEPRARRLFRAGLAAEASGDTERAERLLTEAAELTQDVELRCDAIARRSYLLFDRGDFDRALQLATRAAAAAAPAAAARLLTASGVVHAHMHRLAIRDALEAAERADRLAGETARADLDLCHMLAWTFELSGRTTEALALATECLPRVDLGSVLAIDIAAHFVYLEDYVTGRELLEDLVTQLRQASAFGNLAYALDHLANLDLRTGRTVVAYAHSVEAVQLMESIGIDVGVAASHARLGLIEALLGKNDDARAHGARALEVATARGDRWNEVRARAALGLEAFSRGDFAVAVDFLDPAVRMLNRGGVRLANMFRVHGDLIEALARTGRHDEAEENLAVFTADAELTGSAWAAAVAARCRAVLASDDECESAFDAALAGSGVEGEFERARTLLAFGERLRRLRRRRDAREPLQLALGSFEHIGATSWADRAEAELRATGERVRPRGRLPHEELTPQELQVALAAADGLTNKEIAARLFLSPKTVEFHLTHVYRKLGVRSRVELAGVLQRTPELTHSLTA
jgi:DNA-binding NarL/FixJ family response regulator